MFRPGKPSQLYDKSNPDWVPPLNLGHSEIKPLKGVGQRYERAQERAAKRRCVDLDADNQSDADEEEHNTKDDIRRYCCAD